MKLLITKNSFGNEQIEFEDIKSIVIMSDDGAPICFGADVEGRILIKSANEDKFAECLTAIGYKSLVATA